MNRHVQARMIREKIYFILKEQGWKECSYRIFKLAGTGDDLNREFSSPGIRDTLLVSENASLEGISWQISVTFPFRTLESHAVMKEKLDCFRVLSWDGSKTPIESGCEFIIHRNNWEGLIPTEAEFLDQFRDRLKAECSKEEPKRRSLSPKRSPPPLEDISPPRKVTSIFWVEWGKNKERFPARMAAPAEVPLSNRQHVYFFGSHRFAPFESSKKKPWESYTTKQKKLEEAIAEAKKYAGIN
jgi:hypothetical protein